MAEIVAIIASVATVAVSAYSSWSSSRDQKSAEHKTERLIQNQAEQARLANEQKASDYKRRAVAALGIERASRGASGIGMEGSPLLTYYENAKMFDEDIARIRQGAEVEERGYMQQAALHKSYAKAQETAGWLSTGETLLTGATNVFKTGRSLGAW